MPKSLFVNDTPPEIVSAALRLQRPLLPQVPVVRLVSVSTGQPSCVCAWHGSAVRRTRGTRMEREQANASDGQRPLAALRGSNSGMTRLEFLIGFLGRRHFDSTSLRRQDARFLVSNRGNSGAAHSRSPSESLQIFSVAVVASDQPAR